MYFAYLGLERVWVSSAVSEVYAILLVESPEE